MTTRRLLAALMVLSALVFGLAMVGCGSSTTTTTTTTPAATTAAAPTTVPAPTTTATTAPPFAGQTLTVSAASSLKAVLTEFATAFEQQTGAKITYNFAASGVLQKQIEGGAPVDVFASASAANVDALVKANLVDQASVATFAGNEIVLAVPSTSTLGIASFADLAKAEVKKVATADPAVAPQGKSAIEVLTGLELLDAVKPKLIYAANAAQTYDYVARGEVDAAILFYTDVFGKTDVKLVEKAPATSYKPVKYVAGVVTASKAKPLSQAFISGLLWPEGQALFAKYGFKAP
jgi:molybdate transport system substrate-binding protein